MDAQNSKINNIKQNYHIHSLLSGCAREGMTIEAIIAEAKKHFLTSIAITDHIDNPKTRDRRGRELIKEYDKVKNSTNFFDLQVFLGCETTQTNPDIFSINDETASRMDIVLVACNHSQKYVSRPHDISPVGYANHYLLMVEGALNWKYTNIIAHPFHLHKFKGIDYIQVLINYDRNRLKNILKVAADRNIAFELCPRHLKNHLSFFTELLVLGREFGAKFSIGADAHKLNQIGYNEEDIKNLQTLGIRKEDLWINQAK